MSRSNSKLRLRNKSRHKSQQKSKSKEEVQLTIEDLQYLTDTDKSKINQHKKRFTKDGRACASAFAFNGQVFHDCSDGTSPDNKNTGDEWCYVDANAGGSPNWGYCKPILDYDAVRRKVQNQYIKMTLEARKVDHLVEAQIMPTSKLTAMVAFVKNKQLAVDFKINTITNQLNKVNDDFQVLLNLKSQYEELEVEIEKLKTEVEGLEAKKEADGGKDPNNCDGMLGYENEGPGDGVKAQYFDNEDFMGEPGVDRVDNQIDFQWENEEPAPGITQDNFSIKWSAWLRVPVNGKYNFYTESDDGNQLLLNGKPLIKHFWSQTGKEGGNWLDAHIGNLRKNIKPGQVETNAEAGLIQAQSYPVSLEGGNKYKLEFNMYHSVHNEEHDTGQAFAKLFWENQFMEKQIISQDFLYTENKVAPIKLFNYDPKLARITELREDDQAFLNNDIYKVQDIPFHFQGAAGLKLVRDWPYDDFKFSVNGAIILYIAAKGPDNPLGEDFKFTSDVLSVMKVNPKDKPTNGKVRAQSSACYLIYKKKFSAGDHVVTLATPKDSKNHLLVFYTPDPGAGTTLSCGGEEVVVSMPGGADFQGCTESSRFNANGWGCQQGFSGNMQDNESSMWATDQQAVGAFISLALKNPYQITKIQIKDRNNAIERNSKIEIKLDGGETRVVSLKNLESIQTFKIEPGVISKTIRMTIKQVFSGGNNGGSFKVFGTPCADPKKLDNPDKEDMEEEPKELTAACEDTVLASKFESIGLKPDMSLNIVCPESCAEKDGNVYGDLEYSEDSNICKTAFHAGALGDKGGKFKMGLKGGMFEYKGAFRSGLQSKSKQGNSILTLVFEKDNSQPDISDVLKQGMKVDIFDDGLKQWMAGSLESVERVSPISAKVVVAKDNMSDDTKESLTWPNWDKMDYCGKQVKKRECDKDSAPPAPPSAPKMPKGVGGDSVKIAFGLEGAPQGYLLDKGAKYGLQGDFTYGWTIDATANIRQRVTGEGIQNQLVLFPPSVKSTYCMDPNPKFSCAENNWKIKMAKGSYNVKLVMGDIKYQTQYDLAVNGVKFVSGKILKKDQFLSETKKVKVTPTDPYIKIQTKCQADNCEFSWSRISAIEIERAEEEEKGDKEQETAQSGCGEAFEGGRCNTLGQNIENCLYKMDDPFQSNCFGINHLVDVDHSYFCKDQIGKVKCIKVNFKDQSECEKKCPGKCKAKVCQAKAAQKKT